MISLCVSRLSSCLERLTDGMLRNKNPPHKPIVGDLPLTLHITSVKKGNFVIEAHTGAGKTTLGLMLYHKARLNEIPEYDVIYVNLRETAKVLDLGREEFSEKILTAIFNHESDEYKKAENYIYSSTKLHIECSKFYECVNEYSKIGQYKKLIVVLDEFERAFDWGVVARVLNEWFSVTRKIDEGTGLVPIKLVILLPKILKVRDFEASLRSTNEAVAVFTEFKTLNITEDVLRSYIRNLSSNVNNQFAHLLLYKEFERLIKVLSRLQSGRYIFPKLWEAISISVCRAVNGVIQGSEEEFLRRFNVNLPDININEVVDPLVIGISEGKPFKTTSSKSTAIDMWERGFSNLCVKVRNHLLGVIGSEELKPLKIGYMDFVCKPNDAYIWITLGKKINVNNLKTIGNKILESIGLATPLEINVVALIPKFTKGILTEGKLRFTTEEGRESRRRRLEIIMKIKQKTLETEELLSIATKGGLIGFDDVIASNTIDELAHDIASMIRSGW